MSSDLKSRMKAQGSTKFQRCRTSPAGERSCRGSYFPNCLVNLINVVTKTVVCNWELAQTMQQSFRAHFLVPSSKRRFVGKTHETAATVEDSASGLSLS